MIDRIREGMAADSMAEGGPAAQAEIKGRGNHWWCELEVNGYPRKARFRATAKDALAQVIDSTNCSITTRGVFIPEGQKAKPGQKPLHLFIQGVDELSVMRAKMEVVTLLEEISETVDILTDSLNQYKQLRLEYN